MAEGCSSSRDDARVSAGIREGAAEPDVACEWMARCRGALGSRVLRAGWLWPGVHRNGEFFGRRQGVDPGGRSRRSAATVDLLVGRCEHIGAGVDGGSSDEDARRVEE